MQNRDGSERPIGRKQPGRSSLVLAIVVRQLGLCGEGVGHRLVWQVPSGATTFLLFFHSFASLCSILLHLSVEQSSLFSPSPSFSSSTSSPRWRSPILRAGSNRLLFVSRWQPSVPTVLCSLTPPSNKAPSHTPTHRLAGLRNG